MQKSIQVTMSLALAAVAIWCFTQPPPESYFSEFEETASGSVTSMDASGLASATDMKKGLRCIEDIRVGMRVLASNPTVTETERKGFVDPDSETWSLFKARLTKQDGGELEITMIRPNSWLQKHGIVVGRQVPLDMPELGAQGLATIAFVARCPTIEKGEGEVVISTFAHPATHQILDVTFGEVPSPALPAPETQGVVSSDLSSPSSSLLPIGVTATHPFWSVRDQAFVPIGQLSVGDEVITLRGDTKRITSILPRPGPSEKVYNLEVNGEHTYFVGKQQLLVHNNGCGKIVGLGKHEHLHELGDNVLLASNRGWTNAGLTAAHSNKLEEFSTAFFDATRNADGIRFNLRGVSFSVIIRVRRSVSIGARNINRVTEWELRFVFNNPALRNKTTFFLGDQVVHGSDLGGLVELLRQLD